MWELGFGKSNLVRSEDSGKSWSTVSDVGSEIFSVAVHPADPKQV